MSTPVTTTLDFKGLSCPLPIVKTVHRAAGTGLCIVPLSARQVRSDLRYRVISDPQAVSPVILSHRTGDRSPAIATVREIIAEIYAENPPWLGRGD